MNQNHLITRAVNRLNWLVEDGKDNTLDAEVYAAFIDMSLSQASIASELNTELRKHHATCLAVLAECEKHVPEGLAALIRVALGSGKDRFDLEMNHGTAVVRKVPASVSIAA